MMAVNTNNIRSRNGWLNGFVDVTSGDSVAVSVVFSWDLHKAIDRVNELRLDGCNVTLGGPAAKYAGLQTSDGMNGAVVYHNPNACSTSTGCPNKCHFCIVPKIEGDLREKDDDDWEPKPIVYDNNLTACSRRHFDLVIDRLKRLNGVDINQGIDARLTSYHASRLAELDMKVIRLAWDNIQFESQFMKGWKVLRDAGFPSRRIGVYVLIGFQDTPDDSLYRLETIRKLGGIPFPMRYQPLDTPKRNHYVGNNWTNNELVRYCRYWANLRITNKIPFNEFEYPLMVKL